MSGMFEKVFAAELVNDEVEHLSAWFDVADFDRLSLMVQATETNTAGTLTVQLEASAEARSVLAGLAASPIPLLTPLDMSAAGSNVTALSFTATGTDIMSKYLEDVIRSVRVRLISGSTTDGTDFWTVNAWIAGKANGKAT
jgi:hypothetical protein